MPSITDITRLFPFPLCLAWRQKRLCTSLLYSSSEKTNTGGVSRLDKRALYCAYICITECSSHFPFARLQLHFLFLFLFLFYVHDPERQPWVCLGATSVLALVLRLQMLVAQQVKKSAQSTNQEKQPKIKPSMQRRDASL